MRGCGGLQSSILLILAGSGGSQVLLKHPQGESIVQGMGVPWVGTWLGAGWDDGEGDISAVGAE